MPSRYSRKDQRAIARAWLRLQNLSYIMDDIDESEDVETLRAGRKDWPRDFEWNEQIMGPSLYRSRLAEKMRRLSPMVLWAEIRRNVEIIRRIVLQVSGSAALPPSLADIAARIPVGLPAERADLGGLLSPVQLCLLGVVFRRSGAAQPWLKPPQLMEAARSILKNTRWGNCRDWHSAFRNPETYKNDLALLVHLGLLESSKQGYRLTEEGRRLAQELEHELQE